MKLGHIKTHLELNHVNGAPHHALMETKGTSVGLGVYKAETLY